MNTLQKNSPKKKLQCPQSNLLNCITYSWNFLQHHHQCLVLDFLHHDRPICFLLSMLRSNIKDFCFFFLVSSLIRECILFVGRLLVRLSSFVWKCHHEFENGVYLEGQGDCYPYNEEEKGHNKVCQCAPIPWRVINPLKCCTGIIHQYHQLQTSSFSLQKNKT